MKYILKPPFRKIFLRLTLLFVLIIVPIYIISVGLFSKGKDLIVEELLETTQTTMNFIVSDFENDMIRLKSMISEYTIDDDLIGKSKNISTMSDYQKISYVISIQRKLSDIKRSSQYINNIGMFHYPMDRSVQTIGVIDDMDIELSQGLIKASTESGNNIFAYEGKIYLISNVMYTTRKDNPRIAIYIEILPEYINRMISESLGNPDILYFLVMDQFSMTITNLEMGRNLGAFTDVVDNHENQSSRMGKATVNARRYYYVLADSSLNMTKMVAFIPNNSIISNFRNYIVLFAIFTIVVFILSTFYTYLIFRYVHKPIMKLVDAFGQLDQGNMSVLITDLRNNEFGYLYKQFNKTVTNFRNMIDNDYKKEILIKSAQLKQLQSQINPHFLYNSFFLLSSMLEEKDYNEARIYTTYLGRYFKFITSNVSDDVTLLQEIEHVRVYGKIQQMRYRGRIYFSIDDTPKSAADIMVPRLILQPVVENAFEHGLIDKVEDGLLHVTFQVLDNVISIIVEDNGEELSDMDIQKLQDSLQGLHGETTGIINVNKRLIIRYGNSGGIQLSRSEFGGLSVRIFIPMFVPDRVYKDGIK